MGHCSDFPYCKPFFPKIKEVFAELFHFFNATPQPSQRQQGKADCRLRRLGPEIPERGQERGEAGELQEKVNWAGRAKALKKAIGPLGFPIIIFVGIYGGFFSPTESAAVAVLYAFILEFFIFKTIKLKDIKRIALSTAVSTSIVFILVAGGQLFSWVISFAKIPQMMTNAVLGANPSATRILVTVTLFFFIAGMFVDSLVAIIILSPIFYPIAMLAGIDPIHLGIVITLQAAIASVSPPFGCNIFTACAIFNRPYLDIVKGIPPYLIMLLLTTIIVIFVPELSLFLL